MDKDPETDDPMLLQGVALPGDTLEPMAETFVEELLLMGYPDDLILRVFQNPYYQAAHRVYAERGEARVRELIAAVRNGYGVRVRFAWNDSEVHDA